MMRDFYGFQFNGVHSRELGIVRVSDGSRYNDSIIPAFQDKTAQVPGMDGTLYWESFYTNKPFNIQIAFDSLTEAQYRRLRQVFDAKAEGELIFDETPYKAYFVKVQSPPQLKTICFNDYYEEDGQEKVRRVYKGEGTIQFVGYSPYAKSVHKYLNDYTPSSYYDNISEWADSCGMLASKGSLDGINSSSISVYNPGDIPTDWCAFFSAAPTQILLNGVPKMSFSGLSIPSGATYIRVNSKTNLIEACDASYNPTGEVLNKHIVAGDFFKIPVSTSTTDIYTFATGSSVTFAKIDYDYLYY